MNLTSRKARPFLKWAGGKGTLAVEFDKVGLLPRTFNDYYEPFLGGGAVYFYLFNKGAIRSKTFLSDVNKELVNAYNEIKFRPDQMIEELRILEGNLSSERFYMNRVEYNNLKSKQSRLNRVKTRKAALLIYLNKTCFNGLYRENSKGEFNVPYGNYRKPRILDEENILSVSRALQKALVSRNDYSDKISQAKENDFVYFDPPYMPISATSSFTSYSENGFSVKDQEMLAEVFNDLTKRKVKVLVSNSYHDKIKEFYEGIDGAVLNTIYASRYISCDGSGRKPVLEYAITNFNPSTAQKKITEIVSVNCS